MLCFCNQSYIKRKFTLALREKYLGMYVDPKPRDTHMRWCQAVSENNNDNIAICWPRSEQLLMPKAFSIFSLTFPMPDTWKTETCFIIYKLLLTIFHNFSQTTSQSFVYILSWVFCTVLCELVDSAQSPWLPLEWREVGTAHWACSCHYTPWQASCLEQYLDK